MTFKFFLPDSVLLRAVYGPITPPVHQPPDDGPDLPPGSFDEPDPPHIGPARLVCVAFLEKWDKTPDSRPKPMVPVPSICRDKHWPCPSRTSDNHNWGVFAADGDRVDLRGFCPDALSWFALERAPPVSGEPRPSGRGGSATLRSPSQGESTPQGRLAEFFQGPKDCVGVHLWNSKSQLGPKAVCR